MKKSLYVFFFFVLCNANASSYYISPTGSSSANGTVTSPYNFSTAMGKSLVAGDSLIFRGGIYSFNSSQSFSKSGTSTKYVHYVAYLFEIPIFDFRTQIYGSNSRGLNLSGNYMHIKGITVQGAGDNGFYVSGSNNFIDQCTSRWNCDSGFQLKNGSNNLIMNCDSYENFDYETGGISTPNFGGNADGFADKQYSNTGTNTYKGCRSWRNGDDGWDSYQKTGNTVYDSCWCYSMAPATFDMSQNIRFKTDSASWFYQFKSTNYVMTNYGNGNGFKLGGDYTSNNATLHNCISVGNKVKGFDQNNNNGIMTIYNCSSYNNQYNYGFTNSSYGTLIIKNCASLNSKSSNSFGCKSVTQAYNTWNTGFSCSSSDFASLDYSQMLNPRQADGSLPEITLLHLVPTSGLINSGINVGLPFEGLAPDLGAFEYQPLTAVTQNAENSVKVWYSTNNQAIHIHGSSLSVEIFGITGNRIFSGNPQDEILHIPAVDFTNGIYVARVIQPDGTIINQKFLIIK